MTRVCLVGEAGSHLQYELLSRETARDALAAYDLREPYENTVAVETVSLGAAVSLLNDLDWYLTRFVDDALVYEPSVSDTEWLSRGLATLIRNDELDPDETGRFLKVYGVVDPNDETDDSETDPDAESADDGQMEPEQTGRPKLVEPMFLARTGERIPDYDLRDVDDTLVVRVTKSEFEA
jgi:hypothetical protein